MPDLATLTMSIRSEGADQAINYLDQLGKKSEEVSGKVKAMTVTTQGSSAGFNNFYNAIRQTNSPLSELANKTSSTTSLFSNFGVVAAGVAVTLGAITVAISKGIIAFSDYERQILRIQGLLRVSGGASGQSIGSINTLAQQIDDSSFSSKSQVRNAAAVLLQFQNIRDSIFTRTIKISSDLAEVMGTDLSTAAWQLGKALEQPAEGFMLLQRAGVRFSETEKQIIERMVDQGNGVEAQNLILSKLEQRMKGVAEVAHSGLAGAFDELGDSFKAFFLAIGKNKDLIDIIDTSLRALTTIVESAKDAVEGFSMAFERLGGALSVVKSAIESIPGIGSAFKAASWIVGNYTEPLQLPAGIAALQNANYGSGKKTGAYSFNPSAEAAKSANDMKKAFEDMGREKEWLNDLIKARSVSEENYNYMKAIVDAEKELAQMNISPSSANGRAFIDRKMELYELQKQLDAIGESYKRFEQFMSGVGDAIGQAFEDAILNGKDLSEVLKSLAADIAKLALRSAMEGLFSGGGKGGGLMGVFSSIFGGLFANGAAFSNGRITPFASGGIISSPTVFPFANGIGLMGEAGAEAIMPLKRLSNGALGVRAEGSGSTVIQNSINVTVQGSTGDSNKDSAYAQKVGYEVSRQVRALVADEIRVQMRPGNMLNPTGRN